MDFSYPKHMMYQNKSELTKDNNNKRNDHEDGDNLSDIADNIVDAFEIEAAEQISIMGWLNEISCSGSDCRSDHYCSSLYA